MPVRRCLIPMVTTPPPAEGAPGCDAAGSPPGGELRAGGPAAPAMGGRGAGPVLASVHPARLLCTQHAVKGDVVFVPFLHPVDFFSWDPVNVSSTQKRKKRRHLVKAICQEGFRSYKSRIMTQICPPCSQDSADRSASC